MTSFSWIYIFFTPHTTDNNVKQQCPQPSRGIQTSAGRTSFLLRLKGFTLSFFDRPGPVPRFTGLGGWDKGRPLASLAAGHGSEVLKEGWLLQLTDLVTIRIFLRLIVVVVVVLIISECDVDRNAVCAVSVMVGN